MKQLSIVPRPPPHPKLNPPGERSVLEGIREHVSQLSPEEVQVYLGQPENEADRDARRRAERNARAREARRIKKAEKAKR
jgi:hypothetical protein